MNISDLITEFGAYYEASGQNKSRILGMLTQGEVTPSYMTPIKTDDTIFKLGKLSVGNLVQSFQKGWTPKSSVAITPNELRLYNLKVDLDIYPDEIEATWLGFLSGDSISRAEWPLIKFLLEHEEQGLLKRIQQDMELYEYGHGVFAEPTEGQAGATGSSMNGFIKLLQDGVEAETINSIDIDTLDKDTILDQVELFIDGISQIYQGQKMDVFMSEKWAKYFLRDKRNAGYYVISGQGEIKNDIDFSPQRVIGLPSLHDTDIIFATPKSNFIHLMKKSANKTKMKIEESKRTVSLLTDWWEGVGFGMDAVVWTNIQKSGSGSGSI